MNPILLTDAYNLSHYFLKKNVKYEISYIYNRARSMILAGFSGTVNNILNIKITDAMVIEAETLAKKMNMPFPTKLWESIVNNLDGAIPLKVESLPDGMYVPKNTPFAKISNTAKGYGEIVTWFEAIFLQNSFESGCATRAFEIRKYLDKNKLNLSRVHSFGLRGHNGMENATKAGNAWRLFLNGTDDFHTQKHTDGKGTSIPATAHKTIQQFDSEIDAYFYSIDHTKKSGFNTVAIVIDTYDPNRFIKFFAKKVAQYAQRRNVTVIFRPDSGDVKSQAYGLFCIMWSAELIGNTGCIIGESMTFKKIKKYDNYFKNLGCPLSWINYGIGSGFYKDIDRDYLGYAMKTAYSNGKNRMKFSADSFKESLPGNFTVYKKDKLLRVGYNIIDTAYEVIYDGDISKVYSWQETKKLANSFLRLQLQETICIDSDVRNEVERLREKYIGWSCR